jgi:hypothetical protein
MAIRNISITEATPAQLSEYVRTFLNLEVSGHETPEELNAKIDAAQPGATMIFVNEPDTPAQVTAQETAGEVPLRTEEPRGKQAGSLGQGDPRAVIHIPIVDTEDESGKRDVLVGVNGRAWQLKRGHDLTVPWRVVVALQNAVTDVVRHSQAAETLGDVTVSKAQRVAFNMLERPSEAELAEWNERVGQQFCA